MSGAAIPRGAKIALYILLLLLLADGLGLLFFQSLTEMVFGAKLLDPDLARLFGAHFMGLVAILGFALSDGTVPVVRPVVKGLLIMEIVSLGVPIYNLVYGGLYAQDLYIQLLVTVLVFLALLVYALKMLKQ